MSLQALNVVGAGCNLLVNRLLARDKAALVSLFSIDMRRKVDTSNNYGELEWCNVIFLQRPIIANWRMP
jgi:hypothetical protein